MSSSASAPLSWKGRPRTPYHPYLSHIVGKDPENPKTVDRHDLLWGSYPALSSTNREAFVDVLQSVYPILGNPDREYKYDENLKKIIFNDDVVQGLIKEYKEKTGEKLSRIKPMEEEEEMDLDQYGFGGGGYRYKRRKTKRKLKSKKRNNLKKNKRKKSRKITRRKKTRKYNRTNRR